MPPSVAGSVASSVSAAERILKIPNGTGTKAERVEAKYDVVLEFPNLELHSAAASGNVGLVHYALTHGQPVNSLLHGCLPLHAACSGGSVSVVRMLIERGADVNSPRLPRRYSDGKRNNAVPAVGTVGSTPLHFAAANGHTAIVQILLACGAVPNKPDKNGMTPEDLADLSNYDEVVRAIQVWTHLNGSQRNSQAISETSSGPSRPRADSMTSNLTIGSDVSDSGQSRKGKERATSMVSAASEKARLLRNSFGNGLRQRASMTSMTNNSSSGSSIQLPKEESSAPASPAVAAGAPPHRPPPLDLQMTPTIDNDNDNDNDIPSSELPSQLPSQLPSELPSPFGSPSSPTAIEEPASSSPIQVHTPESAEPSPPLGPSPGYQRSSRRPSLPSIFEKAAHPGQTFRQAMRKTEHDSSPSITESETSRFHRGRKAVEPTQNGRKINKHAILGLFRRGQDTISRSPSPPEQPEVGRPDVPDQLEQGIARLKRASMDPEMMQMAMDVAQLGDQLEAAAAISAPVSKTRFFEDQPDSPPERQSSLPVSRNVERTWDRRNRTAVMSPSPLANEWAGEDSDEPRPASVRRTRTEIRRSSHRDVPRRIPSAPSMPQVAKRRSMTLPSQYSSPLARTVESPSASTPSLNGSNLDSPVPCSPSDDEQTNSEPTPTAEEAVLAAEEPTPTAATAEEAAMEAASGAEANGSEAALFYLDTPVASASGHEVEVQSCADPHGRIRGHSIGSAATDSSRAISTAPTSQLMTPPAPPSVNEDPPELSNLGLFPMPPEKQASEMAPLQKQLSAEKERSMSSLGSGLPADRSSRASSRRSSRPMYRQISSHAEAHQALKQDEADVLELAQLPASEDSSRSLADQLAAYGESHALAAEFARHERLSSLSSSSGTRTSVSGSELSAPSRRSSAIGRRPSPSSPKVHLTMDPTINKIYDRRATAYRNQLQALTSTPPIHGLKQREASNHAHAHATSMPNTHSPRHRATSGSEMWLNRQPTAPTPRRLTEPTSRPPQDMDHPHVDHHPHISNPMPVVSDLGTSTKPKRPKALASSLKTATNLASSLPRTTFPPGTPSTPHPFPSEPERYKGLAQARSYAAHHGILSDRYASRPGDGEDSDDPDVQSYTMVDNGLHKEKEKGKWGLKVKGLGAVGRFRR